MLAAPAYAAEGSIDHVQNVNGKLQVLYSLPASTSAGPDLGSLDVRVGDQRLDAQATLASDATDAVRRTAVLAVDVSNSMKANDKFTEAKRAAQIFVDSAPDDLYVGIVTFAGTVTVAQRPTLDRSASVAVLNKLRLSAGTRLYDGLQQAVSSGVTTGQRSVIVLSDGRDQSRTKLSAVTRALTKADVKVDVVALDQSRRDQRLLEPLATGGGSVIDAKDPKALGAVFASEAQSLAKQIQVTADVPAGTREGTLEVSVDAGGQTFTDSAYVTLKSATPAVSKSVAPKLAPAPQGLALSPKVMYGGLAAAGLSVLVIVLGLLWGGGRRKESLESRIEAYTQQGQDKQASQVAVTGGVAAQAVGMANRALAGNRGFETRLGDRLDAAAVSLKPAEWLLVHTSIALAAGAVAYLFSSGNVLVGLLGFVAGGVLPWMWLGIKRSRRLRAFNGQLAGCLQLLAGSLQAGLSLAQGLDTVVREGHEPLAGEFRRALVETRLGVPIETALESISERMESARLQVDGDGDPDPARGRWQPRRAAAERGRHAARARVPPAPGEEPVGGGPLLGVYPAGVAPGDHSVPDGLQPDVPAPPGQHAPRLRPTRRDGHVDAARIGDDEEAHQGGGLRT